MDDEYNDDGVNVVKDVDDRKQKIKAAIIEWKQEFPGKLRTVIDEAKNDTPTIFLSKIECKLNDLLKENYLISTIDESKGLN